MIDESNRYNGWANRETWLVKLWIDNEEPSYRYWNEQADECLRRAEAGEGNPYADSAEQRARIMLTDTLKDQFEDQALDLTGVTGMWTDLLSTALGRVEWREIAGQMIDDAIYRKGES